MFLQIVEDLLLRFLFLIDNNDSTIFFVDLSIVPNNGTFGRLG